MGDVIAGQQHAPGAGRQDTGQQIDEGRLAGAIGADQGVARASFETEADIVGRNNTAEALQNGLSALTPEYWLFWIGLFLVAFVMVGRDRLLLGLRGLAEKVAR